MNNNLKQFGEVFKHFEDLTKIPRESGNEKQVSDFLVQFAKKHQLEVIQDDYLNVVIKKPGTKGYENYPTVILQGHMDMVCVKKDDFTFDFKKDPIPIVIDGDFIKTKGTSLGADNGIAVAMGMALLESKDYPHPPLTVLITVEEETGMSGVLNLKKEDVSGDILINLDSEEEGIFLTSCAGGVRNLVRLPIEFKDHDEKEAFEIKISGLLGGHSGMEINKNRASAIKLMGRLLDVLDEKVGIHLISISGGEKMNAIPKMAKAVITTSQTEMMKEVIEEVQALFSNEFQISDPNIKISYNKTENKEKVLSDSSKRKLISTLRLMPFGVQTMSANIKGLVESSINIGVVETNEKEIILSSAVRSSVKSLKHEINNRIKWICELTGASMELLSDYPEWEYQKNSPIRDLMQKVYKELYQSEAEVQAIHAGLECGFLKEKLGDIDMISMGPNMFDVHTPEERVSISSTQKVYSFLCEVLKNIHRLNS